VWHTRQCGSVAYKAVWQCGSVAYKAVWQFGSVSCKAVWQFGSVALQGSVAVCHCASCNVFDHIFDDFLENNTVFTPYIYTVLANPR